MTTTGLPKEGTLAARGLQFHYLEWGEAAQPALVLLHGLNSHCHIWDTLARSLSRDYHIFALDQRGHGDTSWPSSPAYATEDYVADLEALVDAWGLGRFAIIGLSMGGHNAIAYAARHPERVSHLVPVDIGPSFNREANKEMRAMQERIAREGHPQFDGPEGAFQHLRAMNTTTPDEALRHRVAHLLKRLPDGKLTFKHDPKVGYYWQPADLWPLLPAVSVPVLIVRGGKSLVLAEEVAQRMVAAFPRARLLTVAEAGHTVPEDRPSEFERAVRAFLQT